MTASPLDELFGALADPTRRRLLERLMTDGPQTATNLAGEFTMTRQAVVKHVQALVAAQLATPERTGREVRYRATPERLALAVAWLTGSSAGWDRRIERLVKGAKVSADS